MAFLSISEAIAKHGKSESTYRRLIRDVRKSGEARKRVLIKPSEQDIEDFKSKGEQFSYTISDELIEQELFGHKPPREQGSQPTSSAPNGDGQAGRLIDKLEQRYEDEIRNLRKQLEDEKREKSELLRFAQEDKKLFAEASQSLTKVLALPGITEANKAHASRPIDGKVIESRKGGGEGTRRSTDSDRRSNKRDRPRRRSLLQGIFRRA